MGIAGTDLQDLSAAAMGLDRLGMELRLFPSRPRDFGRTRKPVLLLNKQAGA